MQSFSPGGLPSALGIVANGAHSKSQSLNIWSAIFCPFNASQIATDIREAKSSKNDLVCLDFPSPGFYTFWMLYVSLYIVQILFYISDPENNTK